MTGFSESVHAVINGRSMGLCEVCGDARVTDHHHRRPRGAGGSKRPDTNTAANGLGICHGCHRMIELNRRVALLMGWLLRQPDQPNARPVMYRGVWRYLHDDGNVSTEAWTDAL